MIDKLIDYGIIVRVGEGYDYSEGFKESYRLSFKAKTGRLDTVRLAKDMAALTTPMLAAYAKQLKSRQEVREATNLAILLVYHLRRVKDDRLLKDVDSANILYKLYQLDKTMPDVELK